MSDLSDLTALPDGLREAAAKQAVAYARMLELGGGVGLLGQQMFEDMLAWDELTSDHHADTVLALFAELDGLRAQIEEALRLRNKPGAHKEHVLAAFDESPRGTVTRIQADALDAVAAKCASFDAAEFMRREAAALREGAGR